MLQKIVESTRGRIMVEKKETINGNTRIIERRYSRICKAISYKFSGYDVFYPTKTGGWSLKEGE